MTTAQTLKKLQKGFTLIELLIVMAVIAVLAGVVLVAMDPAEQLERARDSGRKSSIGQLASAMQAYVVAQGQATAPAASNTWQQTLVNAGELKAAIPASTNTSCTPLANAQNGICYAPGAGTEFFIWTRLESKAETDRAEGTEGTGAAGTTTDPDAVCASTEVAVYVYDSSRGRSGNACITNSTVPTTATPLF